MSGITWANDAPTKRVDVYGKSMDIPLIMSYLTISEAGYVWAWEGRAFKYEGGWVSEEDWKGNMYLGQVDLGDVDWTTTLRRV